MSMQRFIHIIRGLLSIVLTACSFGDEPAICPYNTRLEYWYAGSGTQNMLPTYVDNLRQYLFDADGQLLSEITIRGDSKVSRRVTAATPTGFTTAPQPSK